MNSKACAKCRETKNFNQFPRHSGHKDGVQSSCKDCKAVSDKIYYSQNKEKCRLLQSAYREQNRDSINARKIAYAKENRALILSKENPNFLTI